MFNVFQNHAILVIGLVVARKPNPEVILYSNIRIIQKDKADEKKCPLNSLSFITNYVIVNKSIMLRYRTTIGVMK